MCYQPKLEILIIRLYAIILMVVFSPIFILALGIKETVKAYKRYWRYDL